MCSRSRRGTGANSLGQSALTNASHIGNHNSAQVLVMWWSFYIAAFICTYLTKKFTLQKVCLSWKIIMVILKLKFILKVEVEIWTSQCLDMIVSGYGRILLIFHMIRIQKDVKIEQVYFRSRTLPFTRQTWLMRRSWGCPWRPSRSWTGRCLYHRYYNHHHHYHH